MHTGASEACEAGCEASHASEACEAGCEASHAYGRIPVLFSIHHGRLFTNPLTKKPMRKAMEKRERESARVREREQESE